MANRGGGSIWIAKGTYYPDINKQAPRTSTFQLKENIGLYGGFAGNEKSVEQRNIENNPVILSGNIGMPLHNNLHSCHVVTGAKYCSINGVIIEQGRADGTDQNRYGGGLIMIGNDQTVNVKHTTFLNNRAYYGGAVYAFNNVNSHFYDVKMVNNHASMGGALYLSLGSNIIYQQGTLSHNTAGYRGGAIVVNYGSNPTLRPLLFQNNSTTGMGGAIWIDDQASQFGGTKARVSDCDFMNNSAQYAGGAVAAVNKGIFHGENNSYYYNRAKNYNNVYQQQSHSPTMHRPYNNPGRNRRF